MTGKELIEFIEKHNLQGKTIEISVQANRDIYENFHPDSYKRSQNVRFGYLGNNYTTFGIVVDIKHLVSQHFCDKQFVKKHTTKA